MPEIQITDGQHERLEGLRQELADHAGPYATVRTADAVEYLLDLAETVDDPTTALEGDAVAGVDDADLESADADGAANGTGDGGTDADADADDGDGDAVLDTMLNLLETHDDKWRESSGDERYEVDLPDGGVETARTKDDVKALLFQHY